MNRKAKIGISRGGLRLIGMILLALGMMGKGILQNRVLGVSTGTGEQLLQVLNMDGGMQAATAALILEAMESCAVPIFAVLTVDGFMRAGSFRNYLLRVLGLAAISEIPYNLAISAKLVDPSSRNPVFGIAICLIVLYLYRHYQGRSLSQIVVKLVVTAAAFLWTLMLGVHYGALLLILVIVLWAFRERPSLKSFLGAAVAICCCVVNPLYMFTAFGFLPAHVYNGEEGKQAGKLHYVMYPLLLVLTAAVGFLLF